MLVKRNYQPRHCTSCRTVYVPNSANQKRCSACGTAKPPVTTIEPNDAPETPRKRRKKAPKPQAGPLPRFGGCISYTWMWPAQAAGTSTFDATP